MLKKCAFVALCMLPAIASAQPYLVAGLASGSTDMGFIEAAFDPGFESDDEFQRAVIGLGFRASEYLAVEGVYLSKADSTVSGTIVSAPSEVELEHQGLQLSLLALAPLTPQFALFGKLSASVLAIDMDTKVMGSTVMSDSDAASYLGAGVGAQIQFNDKVGLRLGVERTLVREYADYSDGDFDIDQASATLLFSF